MITLGSLLHLFLAICWGCTVFLAISGLGAILLRGSGLRRASLAMAAVAGFGVTIFCGGCLNLLHAINHPVRLCLVGAGLAGFILTRPRLPAYPCADSAPARLTTTTLSAGPARQYIAEQAAFWLATVVFVVRLAATVHTPYYQHDDDYNFYLAAPVKMDALHEYAPDPFS